MSKKTMVGRFLRSTMLSGVAAAAAAPVALVATSAILSPAAAQDYTSGAITGTVVDASGAPIAGATITLRSLDQGFTRTATSSSAGGFRFVGLTPGNYEVSAASGGQSTAIDARVQASATANFTLALGTPASSGDEVVVTGTRQNLDFSTTTTGINLDVDNLIKDIPVGRTIDSLIQFAPGTGQGDEDFGSAGFSAIGGGSVAENAYYVNGLNVTNFDNYLGGGLVPFYFYKNVEVKTGGYAAEYGRATGGIVNTVTKSGSNDFTAAVHIDWTPDALRSDSPDTLQQRNGLDEEDLFRTTIELGGPIVKDKLFVYGMVELRDNNTKNAGISSRQQLTDKSKSPFFGFKVDAYPIDNHHLEFTYFDTDRVTNREVRAYDPTTDEVGEDIISRTDFERGGESYVAKYTGNISEWLTLSAAYGKYSDNFQVFPGSSLSRVQDARVSPAVDLSPQSTTSREVPYLTTRKFWRADADVFFSLMGDHHVRVGFDQEKLSLDHVAVRTGPEVINGLTAFPGGLTYIYRSCPALSTTGVCNLPAMVGQDYVELNYFNSGGSFEAKNIAYYVQDEWSVTDKLTLNLGVRLDQFNNYTANGSQFVDFNKLFAPRTGFSYDVFGDGRGRLFGNYGIYYLPVASNTAFRQGAQEWYFREYWTFDDVGNNGIPDNLLTQITGFNTAGDCPFSLASGAAGVAGPGTPDACDITGDGSVQDPTASIATNLKATKLREILVGYEHRVTDLWTLGITYTRRNLLVTAEDSAIDAAILAYCDEQGITGCSDIWTGFHQYTIMNPGFDQTFVLNEPLPGETELRTVSFTAEQLGYPKAERHYDAVEFTFERAFDGVWSLRGSYVWSNTEGNTEGYVKSDNAQDDSGITQDFDQPGLTDGSYGKLPTHKAHRLKMWATYQATENLLVGINASVESPRKFGCIGRHPTDFFASLYGAASNYCKPANGEPSVLVPRGTAFESDWRFNMDVGVRYNIEMPSGQQLVLRGDVFNIFNLDAVTDANEFGEQNNGQVRTDYMSPLRYQEPRSVRVGLDIAF